MSAPRPVSVLIAALGGEGGGLLTDWIIAAAGASDLVVQSTSIPGLAQRTGATTYYIEVFPEPAANLYHRPALALYPSPGAIDLMVASELIEAGRAIENGFVSPDRTTLIASTHRVYAIAEKSAMADGRYDSDRVRAAAEELAARPILGDLAAIARAEATAINSVMLGVIAASGVLPIDPERFADAIRAGGIAIEANLRGFEAGRAQIEGTTAADSDDKRGQTEDGILPQALSAACAGLPLEIREVATLGAARLIDYQDARHAGDYLDRVRRLLDCDGGAHGYRLTREAARHLALWMSYEDVIRVADLKTRAERFAELRKEVGAKDGEPVQITEFLKPSVEEIAAILPAGFGRAMLGWAERHGGTARWQRPMRVRTDRIGGFLRLWLAGRLRFMRRRSLRFGEEMAAIEDWLAAITVAAPRDYDLALEIAECAHLLKGYSDTQRRGRENYAAVMDGVVRPALAADTAPGAAATVAATRRAALADPEGFELKKVLSAVNLGVQATDIIIEQGGKAA
jgi:indolepyruvate ferredoxin oxidoreductase beta subunit